MSTMLLCVQRRLVGWLRCAQSRVAGGRSEERRENAQIVLFVARHINNGNDAPLPTTADADLCMVAVIIAKELEEQGAQRRDGDDESCRVVERQLGDCVFRAMSVAVTYRTRVLGGRLCTWGSHVVLS